MVENTIFGNGLSLSVYFLFHGKIQSFIVAHLLFRYGERWISFTPGWIGDKFNMAEFEKNSTWAMHLRCWPVTEIRQKIMKITLDTFGACASGSVPLYVNDGSPEEIAGKNSLLANSHDNVRYHRNQIDDQILQMMKGLEQINAEYIVTINDDYVLIGDPLLFVGDVESMISMMSKYSGIDAFTFYSAFLSEFKDNKLRFAQPHLKTFCSVDEHKFNISECPRFFMYLGVHRKDRLLSALQTLREMGIKTFHLAEETTELQRLSCYLRRMPLTAKFLWQSTSFRNMLTSTPIYQTILVKPQESAFCKIGEIESGKLGGQIDASIDGELLLEEIMNNKSFSSFFASPDMKDGGELRRV